MGRRFFYNTRVPGSNETHSQSIFNFGRGAGRAPYRRAFQAGESLNQLLRTRHTTLYRVLAAYRSIRNRPVSNVLPVLSFVCVRLRFVLLACLEFVFRSTTPYANSLVQTRPTLRQMVTLRNWHAIIVNWRCITGMYIQTFCDHLNVLYIFDQTYLCFEVMLELYRANAAPRR